MSEVEDGVPMQSEIRTEGGHTLEICRDATGPIFLLIERERKRARAVILLEEIKSVRCFGGLAA